MTEQCLGTTQSGSQCERKCINGVCWQHTLLPELKSELIPELANISYNYLSLEDLLELTNSNKNLQDELVRKFYPDILEDLSFHSYEAIESGSINTLKYTIEQNKGIYFDFLADLSDSAIKADQAEIFEYVADYVNKGGKTFPDYQLLVNALKNKSLKVLKYISSQVLVNEFGSEIKNKEYYESLLLMIFENFSNEEILETKDTLLKYSDYLTEAKILPNNEILTVLTDGDTIDANTDYLYLEDFIIKILGLIPNRNQSLLEKYRELVQEYTSSPAKEKIVEAIQILRLAK